MKLRFYMQKHDENPRGGALMLAERSGICPPRTGEVVSLDNLHSINFDIDEGMFVVLDVHTYYGDEENYASVLIQKIGADENNRLDAWI